MNCSTCRWYFWHAKFSGWETLLCLWSVTILFCGYMPYGIFSDLWLLLCTIRVIHVVPILFNLLAYCGLLLFYLVRIELGGCSQILQIYVCKLIGGDELLISGFYSYLFFIAVVICPTIGGGSFYLHHIFLLWNGFWSSIFISLHCLSCDYLVEPTGTWYPWLSLPFSTMLMLSCPYDGIMGWFRGF